jgi:Cu2+-exporting ATPase
VSAEPAGTSSPVGDVCAGVAACFHCGDPVPERGRWQVLLEGELRPLCCAGCEAVAQTIIDAGLTDYYRTRSALPRSNRERVPAALAAAAALSRPAVERLYTREACGQLREAELLLTGIECAACAWLVERTLGTAPGVVLAGVNYSTHRVNLRWDPEHTDLGQLVAAVQRLGYDALPWDPCAARPAHETERSDRIRRIAVAGLFGMQIMMLSLALYFGEWWGMAPAIETLLRWASMVLCLPLLLYSAAPFFKAAWRGLVNRAPGMDLPVSLGLGIAFVASTAATLRNHGEVYFDSVAMFTLALLLARYLELIARRRARRQIEALIAPAPAVARRVLADGSDEVVPAADLAVADRIRVRPGESVPADGTLCDGSAELDESLLSGESRPLLRGRGEPVVAGSINLSQPIELSVTGVGAATVLAGIMGMVERAAAARPPLVMLADRVASVFVVVVVAVALLVAAGGLLQGSPDWLAATIAVLVVTCPCALSLATPTVLTAVATRLSQMGVVPIRELRLSDLAGVQQIVFDKTGTLTSGHGVLDPPRQLANVDSGRCLRIAAAIEHHSLHPIARALRAACDEPCPVADSVRVHAGEGMQGRVDGRSYWLGAPAWVAARVPRPPDPELLADLDADCGTVVLLADAVQVLCAFRLQDPLRGDAADTVRALRDAGIEVSLFSGDRPAAVARVAGQLGIDDARAQRRPDDKLCELQQLQREGRVVAAVGDGINDAPLLSAADVSMAMAEGAQLARASADYILEGGHLGCLAGAVALARRGNAILKQNLIWAAGYNLLALPAAAMGYIPPWAAAIGMSLSSVIVLGNSFRLYLIGGREHGSRGAA